MISAFWPKVTQGQQQVIKPNRKDWLAKIVNLPVHYIYNRKGQLITRTYNWKDLQSNHIDLSSIEAAPVDSHMLLLRVEVPPVVDNRRMLLLITGVCCCLWSLFRITIVIGMHFGLINAQTKETEGPSEIN